MNQWKPFKTEKRGTVDNKYWVINEKGDIALFKPYDEFKNPVGAEIEASRIANALDIPCARIEEATIRNIKGIVSYDFHENGYTYCPGGNLIEKSQRISLVRNNGTGSVLHSNGKTHGDITMREIQTNQDFERLVKPLVDMLFFDCLTKNSDRHGRNWEIKLDINGKISGLAPLYDHGFCFNDDGLDECQFPWDREENNYVYLKFDNLFSRLCNHYPKQIDELLNKCERIDLSEFCHKRLNKMKKIYALMNQESQTFNEPSPPRRRR